MAESIYKTLTDQVFELYQSFIASGFTEEQALEMTKSQYSFAVINHQIEEKRSRDRQELIRRALKRCGWDGDSDMKGE